MGRRDEIMVFEARDSVKNETFYRPLGGGLLALLG
jgi:hypothetical protein